MHIYKHYRAVMLLLAPYIFVFSKYIKTSKIQSLDKYCIKLVPFKLKLNTSLLQVLVYVFLTITRKKLMVLIKCCQS
jgi:hypothetical protein